jgi:homocysteine S-methyltransferase
VTVTIRGSLAHPVILDGGLSTELERHGADLSDHLWSARLLIDDPALIRDVHGAYFGAGAQVAITATYQASVDGFATRGIDHDRSADLMRLAVRLAREAADQDGRDDARVAASIGPFGATRADGSEYSGDYGETTVDDLIAFHLPRAEVLATAAPDLFAVETIPSLPEAEALAIVLTAVPEVPAWVSFSCRDDARIADGTPVEAAARIVGAIPSVIAVGVNCTAGRHIQPLLQRMRAVLGPTIPLVAYPNAGDRWDAKNRAWIGEGGSSPTALADAADAWMQEGAGWIGGCCGFDADAIEALVAHMS